MSLRVRDWRRDVLEVMIASNAAVTSIAEDRILIASLIEAGRILSSSARQDILYLVSIGTQDEPPPTGFRSVRRRLRLVFDDALALQSGAPVRADIEALIDFAREIDLSKGQLLVHCYAGVSRSAAAAVIILAASLGPGNEPAIADFLARRYPHCRPNRLMLKLADEALGSEASLERVFYAA